MKNHADSWGQTLYSGDQDRKNVFGLKTPFNLNKTNLYKSSLLINLSQTAYFDGLTLSDDRKWYGDSTGLNIIFIRAIGARNMQFY